MGQASRGRGDRLVRDVEALADRYRAACRERIASAEHGWQARHGLAIHADLGAAVARLVAYDKRRMSA